MTYDVRSSRGVVEFLQALGAEPTICKVGHSFAKKLLRDTDGIAGGELAGHYYFRENFFCDSGMIAALVVMEVLAADGRPFSRAVAEIGRYHFSGEINFTVPNGGAILQRVKSDYPGGSSPTSTGSASISPTGGSTCVFQTPSRSCGSSWRPGTERASKRGRPSWWKRSAVTPGNRVRRCPGMVLARPVPALYLPERFQMPTIVVDCGC